MREKKKKEGEKQRSKASERGEKRRSRGEMHPGEMGDEEDVASRFRTPNVVQKFRRTFTRVIYPFSRSKDVANALVRARFRRSFFSWFGFERDPRLARLLGLGYLVLFFYAEKI